MWHIAASSHFVCTDLATSRCDRTLVRCTSSILGERKCKLVQIYHGEKLIDASSSVDLNFVADANTGCDKAACAYFVAAISQTSLNSCDRSQRQNYVAATMIFTCHTRRFVAVTCCSNLSRLRVAAICRIVCLGLNDVLVAVVVVACLSSLLNKLSRNWITGF